MYLRAFRFVANKKTVSFSWNHENDIAIVAQNVTQNVTQNVIQNVTQNVSQDIEDVPRVQKVEQIILVDSMKTKEFLAKMFGVSTRTILRDLKKLGYAWEGASKNGRWVKKNKE
jgi:ATP-dependent DNA helicase RecG